MKKGLDQQQMHHYRTSTFHILYMLMRLQIHFLFVCLFVCFPREWACVALNQVSTGLQEIGQKMSECL